MLCTRMASSRRNEDDGTSHLMECTVKGRTERDVWRGGTGITSKSPPGIASKGYNI